MPKLKKAFMVLAALCIQCSSIHKVSFDNAVYKQLFETARSKGFVRVLVGLDANVSLAELGKMSPEFKQQLTKKEQAVLDELGNTASPSGRWSSGIGQISIYVTTQGLERLSKSRHVKNLMNSSIDDMLSTHFDGTGTLINDIEAEIDENGFADVEVVLNLKNLAWDYMPDGKAAFRTSTELDRELAIQLPLFLDSLRPENIRNITNLKAKNRQATKKSIQHLQIDREGLFALQEHKGLRALRLVTSLKKTPRLEKEVLETAKETGFAGVFISLYQPFGYSPQVGRIPRKAWKSQTAMLDKAFKNIFSSLGKNAVKDIQEFKDMPSIYAVLSYTALQQLYKTPDFRIKSIRLNKGAYGPLLNQSTAFINMHSAWNHNPQYRGAGQQIVILDSAFEKDHPFLMQSNGQSKVVFEACFGTTDTVPNPASDQSETYQSLCPSANPTTGDSPLGMLNSANSDICSGTVTLGNLCFHGTYVAGIAAGKWQWPASSHNAILTGIAPEASIVGVSIMSKQTAGDPAIQYPRLWGTYLDIDKAMTTLAAVTTANNAMTVSLSVGDRIVSGGHCPDEDNIFKLAVASLYSKNIPVVAATGNKNSKSGILWPACTPKVIKVAGTMLNNGNEALWNHLNSGSSNIGSNIVNPSTSSGTFLLAPACVISSTLTGLGGSGGGHGAGHCGTSASTPHVAGLYALIKQAVPGVTVGEATAWILTEASNPVSTGYGYSVQSIKLPPL